jgi:hypothetical protein
MCLECDGYSHEDVMQSLDLMIRVHGWTLVQVEGDDEAWCYTVGLLENYGHPELVLFDVKVESQRAWVEQLVEMIIAKGTLPPHRLAAMKLRIVEVHDDHLRGDLFGTWASRYGEYPQPGDMMQVLLPASSYCRCHAPLVRWLDLPGPLPPPPAAHDPSHPAKRRRTGR